MTRFKIYLHKLWAASVKFLIAKQRKYLRYSKWPIKKASVGKSMTFGILDVLFVKILDIIGAGWNLKS